jgi:hypothetical protein
MVKIDNIFISPYELQFYLFLDFFVLCNNPIEPYGRITWFAQGCFAQERH